MRRLSSLFSYFNGKIGTQQTKILPFGEDNLHYYLIFQSFDFNNIDFRLALLHYNITKS